jgi:hypothetical protein
VSSLRLVATSQLPQTCLRAKTAWFADDKTEIARLFPKQRRLSFMVPNGVEHDAHARMINCLLCYFHMPFLSTNANVRAKLATSVMSQAFHLIITEFPDSLTTPGWSIAIYALESGGWMSDSLVARIRKSPSYYKQSPFQP